MRNSESTAGGRDSNTCNTRELETARQPDSAVQGNGNASSVEAKKCIFPLESVFLEEVSPIVNGKYLFNNHCILLFQVRTLTPVGDRIVSHCKVGGLPATGGEMWLEMEVKVLEEEEEGTLGGVLGKDSLEFREKDFE